MFLTDTVHLCPQLDSCSKVKTKHLDRPYGCSTGHKSCPLHVSRWNMSQREKKLSVGPFFSNMFSVIIGSSYHADVYSRANISDSLLAIGSGELHHLIITGQNLAPNDITSARWQHPYFGLILYSGRKRHPFFLHSMVWSDLSNGDH